MDRDIARLSDLTSLAPEWLVGILSLVGALLGALLVHRLVFALWQGAAWRTATKSDDILSAQLYRAARWCLVALALIAVLPTLPLDRPATILWQRLAGLAVPALAGWLAIALLRATRDIIQERADIGVADNLRARRKRTRASLLYRIALFVVVLVTACLMLLSLPAVRSVGLTLAASAGIVGIAVGAAAQPALKNLIAGIQMAFTEPIRLDDVVIVAGEWGRIEDIRLTYVVVKLWDERRLIVPVAKFLEETFENWTRETSQLLGTAFLHLDPAADVPRLREHFETMVRADPLWDGRALALQVTDTSAGAIEIRCLVSAADASRTFDLRCHVREAMLGFVAAEMPEAIVRRRVELPPSST